MNEGGKTILERTKTKELMEDKVECKDGITPLRILILRFMQGCCTITALGNSSFASFLLISSSFLFNSSSFLFNSSSCLTLSFFSYSFLSFSSCSLLARSFSRSSFSLYILNSRNLSSFSRALFCFSLSLCSLKSKSKLFLKSFSSLENLAIFWMNASPMSMKSSILDC